MRMPRYCRFVVGGLDAESFQGVMEFGAENWTEIVAWAELADRTEKAVKARYKRLLKKQAKMESLQASETESTLSAELQPWPTATIQQVETPKKQSADTELQVLNSFFFSQLSTFFPCSFFPFDCALHVFSFLWSYVIILFSLPQFQSSFIPFIFSTLLSTLSIL